MGYFGNSLMHLQRKRCPLTLFFKTTHAQVNTLLFLKHALRWRSISCAALASENLRASSRTVSGRFTPPLPLIVISPVS